MAVDVEIPELGESVTEAILVEWLKGDGDDVEADEPVAVIETDKADAELPSPAAGVLKHLKKEDDTVAVGEAIGQIEEGDTAASSKGAGDSEGEEASEEEPASGRGEESGKDEKKDAQEESTSAGKSEDGPDLSPAVRRLVEEHDLDASEIEGTGKDGRLTKEDVLKHIDAGETSESKGESEEDEAPKPQAAPAASAEPSSGDGTRREPMSRIRKRIASNLVQAQQNAAMLTTFNEVDMSAIMDTRKRYKERFGEVHGVSLGLMSFFVRAAVLALQEFENVNASIEGEDVVYHDYVHMGIAVSAPKGLVVPVLKHAERMSLADIESEIKRVATQAREGKLGVNDLSGGTFTITNGGVFGSMLSTPILMPPQTGILGMHAIKDRPVAVGDEVKVHPVMFLALTYDHRLVDGQDSVRFLVRMKEYLEDPTRMLLEV